MATRRYGTSRGENFSQINETVGAAVSSNNMEFTFDLALNLSKEDVLLGLEKIEYYILNSRTWPPA